MPATDASGAMMLISEYRSARSPVRVLRLESSVHGKALLLQEIDER
jgi:hypothetical protein